MDRSCGVIGHQFELQHNSRTVGVLAGLSYRSTEFEGNASSQISVAARPISGRWTLSIFRYRGL